MSAASLSAAPLKAIPLALLAALPALAANAVPSSQPPARPTYSQQDLLKNWAFSFCLVTVSRDAASRADAHAAAGAYLAQGRQDVAAYGKLRKFVDAYAVRHQTASTAAESSTMMCIDLLRSAELDRLTAKLARGAK